ncbi:hypothetical protein IG631_11133 [Alternaria alternata]|nr:hypothetical protein IG631_11133 [Alternaria alternata]
MRIYPPLPFPLPRVVPQGGDIVDGHFIPEGVSELVIVGAAIFLGILANYKVPQTIVSTNPFAASMSSQNFLNPWKFDPERWLRKDGKDTLGASQPFSLGTRSCLGKRTILAKLYFKYDLKLLDPQLDWHAQSEMHTLWQKPEMRVAIVSRADKS